MNNDGIVESLDRIDQLLAEADECRREIAAAVRTGS